jgi:hypothetical protein
VFPIPQPTPTLNATQLSTLRRDRETFLNPNKTSLNIKESLPSDYVK